MSETPQQTGPLRGLRVVEFGHFIAAPLATRVLGDLGAEIIKIEPPHGEWLRKAGPLGFATQNAGKESLVVDLRSPGGADVVLRLAERADVFVEGFAPGSSIVRQRPLRNRNVRRIPRSEM